MTSEDFNRINFITLSILPATLSNHLDICSDCHKSIVFREDLNPDWENFDSLAELLNTDMTQHFTPDNKTNFTTVAFQSTTREQWYCCFY